METVIYTVKQISGEYATLVDDDGGELFIALALLPQGTDIGTKLKYFMFNYEIVE